MEPITLWLIVAGYLLIGVIFMGIISGYNGDDPSGVVLIFWPVLLAIAVIGGIVFGIYMAGRCIGIWIEDLFS